MNAERTSTTPLPLLLPHKRLARHTRTRLALSFVGVFWVFLTPFALGAQPPSPRAKPTQTQPSEPKRVTLDFHRAPLTDVAQYISDLTQRNFIFTSELQGAHITVYAPRPVSVEEAWDAFVTALALRGFALQRQGTYWRIHRISGQTKGAHRAANTAQNTPNTMRNKAGGTNTVTLRHADADSLIPVLEQLASPRVRIVPYPNANALILIGPDAHVRRLHTVIRALDQPGAKRGVYFYSLQHADAAEVSRILESLQKP